MSVSVEAKPGFGRNLDSQAMRRAVRRALRTEGARGAITVVIVGDRAIRALNRRFHHADRATDVLAFPGPTEDYIGDILISYETARRNARAAGWRLKDELELLAVHGTLHLLGYEDTGKRAREKMWRRQEEILGRKIPQIEGRQRSGR